MPAALIMPRWARNLGVNMPSPFWKGTSSTVYVDKSQCRLDSPMATLIGVTEDGKVGVSKTIIKRGVGRLPVAKEVVVCHYTGTLASDGTKFDCSKDRGKPLTFMIGIGQVIKGWDEGIMSMHLGEISKLEISSAFAYGEAGSGGKIPPAADLVFEVELLKIGDEKAPSISGGGLAGFGQCTKVFDQCTIA